MNKKTKTKIIFIVILVLILLTYFLSPEIRGRVNNVMQIFAKADVNQVVDYIRQYGSLAAVVSFLLMVFQSVLAPLPAFLITFANSIIFGWWKGAILSWTSAMVGSLLCFYIARIFGRDVVVKFTGNTALKSIEKYFEKYGSKTILICRLLPFISFDLVSYFAGLTPMKVAPFLIATGLGQLPATIVYSYVGGMLTGGARLFVTALLILFAISILVIILKEIFKEKNESK